jgi:CRP-like cAMP-binding protein
VISTLSTGDIVGEMAFLVGTPRAADVVAVSDDVRVLGLSETEIRKVIDSSPDVAAVMMLNVSKILCRRILNMMQ